jgi:hypothetical protein
MGAASKAGAIRSVLIANHFRTSMMPGAYDATRGKGLHKQFWFEFALEETALISKTADNRWRFTAHFLWQPQAQRNDPDAGLFEVGTQIEELIVALANDVTLGTDDLVIQAASPEWLEEQTVWDVALEISFMEPVRT